VNNFFTKNNLSLLPCSERNPSPILNFETEDPLSMNARNIPKQILNFNTEQPLLYQPENRPLPKENIEMDIPLSFHESKESKSCLELNKKQFFQVPQCQINNINNDVLKNSSLASIEKKRNWKDKIKKMMTLSRTKSLMTKKISSPLKENLVKENLEHYQKLKKKENFFSVGFFGFLKLFFKNRKWGLTNREKLFLKGENQVFEELDILKIMKKLQDIDKLKRILLSDEQLYFFELLSKPMIIIEDPLESPDDEFRDRRFKFSIKHNQTPEKERLKEFYDIIQRKSMNSDLDRRILKLLDEDVMCFLKNEKLKE